jgi:hypothetical protein
MQNTSLSIEDYVNIKAYVEESEKNGNSTRVRHLRLLLDEIDRLDEKIVKVVKEKTN